MAAMPHRLRAGPVPGCDCGGCFAVAESLDEESRRDDRALWCFEHAVGITDVVRAELRERHALRQLQTEGGEH